MCDVRHGAVLPLVRYEKLCVKIDFSSSTGHTDLTHSPMVRFAVWLPGLSGCGKA